MNRYSMSIRALSLFLILLCTSCEELEEGTSPFGDSTSSDSIPNVINIHETIDGSSVDFSWEGNEYALEFSYKLKYSLTDSAHLVNKPDYNWSNWTTELDASFNNLDEGNYTFYVIRNTRTTI